MPAVIMEESMEEVLTPGTTAEPVTLNFIEDGDESYVSEEWQTRIEKDQTYRRELNLHFKELRSQAISNVEYFQHLAGTNNERFFHAFHALYEHLDHGIEPGVEELIHMSHMYDIDPDIPANGYRSIVQIIHKCCLHLLQLSRYVSVNRKSFTFRSSHYSKEVEAYVTTLGQLRACLYYIQKLIKFYKKGELFPSQITPEDKVYADSMMKDVEELSQEPFYGRCLGFQHCASMKKSLDTINTAMASFADGYFQSDSSMAMKVASSVLNGSRYFLDPELRAEKVVHVTRTSDVNFCKAFWSLAENSLMHSLPLVICPPVKVDKIITIKPESFEMQDEDGDFISIRVPSAHTGPGPVSTRLISYHSRAGQESLTKQSTNQSPSPGLIVHFHGGGFVAQSSASHEVYLRHWAKDTGVPILSVDYSLAPENPFPRQIEECFFAYCWAVKNCHQLGSTGERICIVGDSAGGNMAVTTAIQAITERVRIPDGILSCYGCMLVEYLPSPSRMMSLMDPLLPIGIMSQCLSAYAGIGNDTNASPLAGAATAMATQYNSNEFAESDSSVTALEAKIESQAQRSSFFIGTEPPELKITRDEYNEHSNTSKDPLESLQTKRDTNKPLSLDLSAVNNKPVDWKRTHIRSPSSPIFPTSPLARSGFNSLNPTTPTYAKIRHFVQSPVDQFRNVSFKSNPKMSPYYAPDSVLQKLPPVYLVACKLDPMLDDSIMFAKRLRWLDIEVHVDALEDLPHGFLNFVLVSQDAWNGSQVCIGRLKEVLGII